MYEFIFTTESQNKLPVLSLFQNSRLSSCFYNFCASYSVSIVIYKCSCWKNIRIVESDAGNASNCSPAAYSIIAYKTREWKAVKVLCCHPSYRDSELSFFRLAQGSLSSVAHCHVVMYFCL